MVQRWNVCAIVFWRVVWYRAGTFLLCDHVRARRGRRGHGVAVAVPWRGRRALDVVASLGMAVVTWPWLWCPLSLCRRRVVATPTNASVCNGFGGVCVVLVCYLTG